MQLVDVCGRGAVAELQAHGLAFVEARRSGHDPARGVADQRVAAAEHARRIEEAEAGGVLVESRRRPFDAPPRTVRGAHGRMVQCGVLALQTKADRGLDLATGRGDVRTLLEQTRRHRAPQFARRAIERRAFSLQQLTDHRDEAFGAVTQTEEWHPGQKKKE